MRHQRLEHGRGIGGCDRVGEGQDGVAEDGEARGRLVVLSRIAAGADLADIEDEAERFAAWVADRVAREEATDEITRQMLEQLTSDRPQGKGKLQ